jgi:predicted nuclease of restriction endonuclease-like (RecB) superfamily
MNRTLGKPPKGYDEFLRDLKQRIRSAQVRAALAVNGELVLLYWQIGQDIIDRQEKQGWGAKIVERISADLREAFPEMQGFSPRNLKYMRAFAAAWPDRAIVQAALAQITWYHNITLVEKIKSVEERLWYAREAVDLKMKAFKPEYAGKMNFYLSAIDDLLRHTDDQPSIGLILCKTKNAIVAEYALRDTKKPIGISGYRVTESLPAKLKGRLPTIQELEDGLKGKNGE